MQRILLLFAGAAIFALPLASAARAQSRPGAGFLVVRKASTDGGVTGSPVATVVVRGFVIGYIAQEGAVELYHLSSGSISVTAQVGGIDVSRRAVTWHTPTGASVAGTEFRGSDFRFRGVGGVWRVVVRGAKISLYAGGEGFVFLHGSSNYPHRDGEYSVNGGPFVSLPAGVVKRSLETK